MKKNITVNLFGTLYAIDDDACKLLEQYLDNMRSYFSKREGGDEITDDIEHRVAELFSELKTNGVEAISIEHVRDIIQRIGNPEQMDESTATNESDAQQSAMLHLLQLLMPLLPHTKAAASSIAILRINS